MKLYVGAVVKNHEKTWGYFKKLLETLFSVFPGTVACVYENDSTDATPRLLAEFQAAHPTEFFYISESVDYEGLHVRTWDNKPYRVYCIAQARNRLMGLLEEKGMGSAGDYCMMVDPDVPQDFITESIIHVIRNFPAEVHALFANAISRAGVYYDTFSYRDSTFPFGVDIYSENCEDRGALQHQTLRKRIPFDGPLIPVMSAFGGLAIYRAETIHGCRYSSIPGKALDDLYHTIYKHFPNHPESVLLKKVQTNPTTHLHGSLLGIYLHKPKEEGGFFYFNCCGANYPIVCEHVNFHAQMIQRGYDKLYICPGLIYLSDHY
jgi:hypothetical protein